MPPRSMEMSCVQRALNFLFPVAGHTLDYANVFTPDDWLCYAKKALDRIGYRMHALGVAEPAI